ncbi:Usp domain-containing protein [Citrus sinensis]|uniref:Usp domain-containing protein n=1 Tax=Citrus sinensis TaxID=2711 RepID=A0ACB8KLZ5_CITSI|nr:Usp domain-containing protein [Citrus sinensis]
MSVGDAAAKERKILVAVDEGDESMYALTWCLTNVISPNSKDTLILLHAQAPRAAYTALDGTGYLFSTDIMSTMDKYHNDAADRLIETAKNMCKDHVNDVKVETRVESGDPRDVICEMVQKLGVDVLVMGSHGYGWFKRAFLGSVSNHCAQNVKCPVLIVKKPKSNNLGNVNVCMYK